MQQQPWDRQPLNNTRALYIPDLRNGPSDGNNREAGIHQILGVTQFKRASLILINLHLYSSIFICICSQTPEKTK